VRNYPPLAQCELWITHLENGQSEYETRKYHVNRYSGAVVQLVEYIRKWASLDSALATLPHNVNTLGIFGYTDTCHHLQLANANITTVKFNNCKWSIASDICHFPPNIRNLYMYSCGISNGNESLTNLPLSIAHMDILLNYCPCCGFHYHSAFYDYLPPYLATFNNIGAIVNRFTPIIKNNINYKLYKQK
jgi:hypothetical protein